MYAFAKCVWGVYSRGQAEHQEVNDGDEEVKWIITRGGRSPIVHNLDGWGKSQDPEKEQGAY